MAWYTNFMEKLFPTESRPGTNTTAVIIDIPSELYYKELAIYTASSLISNAISRSEIKVYQNGKPIKGNDYFLLNVSPNKNETSSVFWHKVINRIIRKGSALVVEKNGYLYVAESYTVEREDPINGDVYADVSIGSGTVFEKKFTPKDYYLFKLDNINVTQLISGMYNEYGKILSTAAKSFKSSNGTKYKLHIEGVKAGDDEFNKEFENYIKKQLKDYISADSAVYPEFDGYELKSDDSNNSGKSSEDFVKLKEDLFKTVAQAFHIPDSMMTGNITNIKDVIKAFLSFGVDPYADIISEGLNKRGGSINYANGNYYQVDTSKVAHIDIFEEAQAIYNLIGSGTYNVDELREHMGRHTLDTEWSRTYFLSKNFSTFDEVLNSAKGGEKK